MTTLAGIVTYSSVEAVLHPRTGALVRTACRVRIRQHGRGTPLVEAVVDTGAGSDGLMRAQAMRLRLRPGTAATAHGRAVVVRDGGKDGPILLLRQCDRVLGGEAAHRHEPTTESTEAAA